jgi:hypothetical protein
LTADGAYVQLNTVRSIRLQQALNNLQQAMLEVDAVIQEMRAEQDPLAVHIFVARRAYRNTNDTKSGKRRDTNARLSWQEACDLGFRGDLGEWERLMGAMNPRH